MVATKLDIEDRMYCTSKRDLFITIKDHKPNYMNNPECRLINPCKSELGKVSKQMLSKIVSALKIKSQLMQWKNTYSVIDWFCMLKDKERLTFIQFDNGSISPRLLNNAIIFAAKY